ncbi:glycoside hydrolase family 3 C-terminal domain-containing protein [Actinacidiphila sp. ITFR-21]|uniref:glycoside hydrolase family 3 C-terminal domain-containing protein n=1 Tax=Actinacidiphila sp. ITFR-21 TaxID=3075199 RepID=UPI002889808E|nr:glycoside hydrolase family 3 C-terminal domain-containing protein [Streptomyces sp. ITFR-21]WNI14540.1 discoidin domain-containing protein [Streptomyces sp. ITFR-21]
MLHSWLVPPRLRERSAARRRRHTTANRSRVAALVGFVLVAALALVATPHLAGAADPVLLSQGKPATASSAENAGTPASAAVDGDPGTRWSSAFSDPQWVQVDLGSSQSISEVVLTWEAAYATAFQIQTSADGQNWTSVYSTTTGTGGTQTLNVTGTGRYVRVYGTARATAYGYSLWEFQVYGGSGTTPTVCGTTTAAVGKPATASSTENAGTPASAAFDGNTGTRWSSAAADPQWLQVDLGTSQSICGVTLNWETAYGKAFQVQTSGDGQNWTTVYSTTAGTGGTETHDFTATGRYVRMYGTVRGTAYGYSLWEFTVLTPGGTTTTPPPGGGDGNCPWVNSTAPVATRVSQVLAQMTQAQKIQMLHGNGGTQPYIGDMDAIPSLCIPAMGFQDGPSGVGDGLGGVTQLPAAVSSAATWDTALQKSYGTVAGAEFKGKGADVALGPTMNIVRDPRWGRAFETYSEDPYLSAQMATASIQGIQSQGVMAQAKHVAVYNQETNRNGPADNAVVDNRTLQEIYLPAFQAAVSKGASASVMCAYSTVNGVYACQNAYLLNNALYQQAGFGGFVTSDWGGAHSTVDSANNGMTIEMPNGYFYADFLNQALANGTVSQATLNTMVSRVLTQMFAFGLFDHAKTGDRNAVVTSAAHQATARQVAEQGSVLLKNTGILPLSTSTTKTIALLGPDGGAGVRSVGGGSATATSSGTVSPLTALQNRLGTAGSVTYNDGTDVNAAVTAARNANVAIVCVGYGEDEGTDLTSIDLPNNQNQLIQQVAAANPNTIVVLNTGSAVTMPWLSSVKGVLEEWYGGQEVGNSLAALLFGDVNPSGKLPVTFPGSLNDVPAHTTAQWPGNGTNVQYSEGLKVGYRWYDAQNITPLFPFGFGLSYTSFSFSGLQVGALDGSGNATVSATVTNTGSKEGAEIAQLYVGDPASTGEPAKQLKGFQRVDLQPGASAQVTFPVTAHDLAYWNTSGNNWTTPAGSYQILVGDSSRNLPLTGTLNVATAMTAKTVDAAGTAAASVTVDNPHGMSSLAGRAVRLPVTAKASAAGQQLTFTATGLPAGLSISPSGVISGTAGTAGTSTVSVTAANGHGASDTASFVWTVT